MHGPPALRRGAGAFWWQLVAAQLAPLQNRVQSCSGARRETSARLYAISIGQLCAFYCAMQLSAALRALSGDLKSLLVERGAMSRLRGCLEIMS